METAISSKSKRDIKRKLAVLNYAKETENVIKPSVEVITFTFPNANYFIFYGCTFRIILFISLFLGLASY